MATGYRTFRPELVHIDNIKPVTVLYGSDSYGIRRRLDRMRELMESEYGDQCVSCFDTGTSSLCYLSGGDLLFGEHYAVIYDASDIATSGAYATRRRLCGWLSANGSSEHVVMSIGSSPCVGAINDFNNVCAAVGGYPPRRVDVPSREHVAEWLSDVADANGVDLDDKTVRELVGMTADTEKMCDAIRVLGNELNGMTGFEIARHIGADAKPQRSRLVTLLAERDDAGLYEYACDISSYDGNDAVTFMRQVETDVFDVIALCDDADGQHSEYVAYKRRHYPGFVAAHDLDDRKAYLLGKRSIDSWHGIYSMATLLCERARSSSEGVDISETVRLFCE